MSDDDDDDSGFPIVEGIENQKFAVVEELLQKGISAYYTDPRFDETKYAIRADPDGSKTLMHFNGTDWEDVRPL